MRTVLALIMLLLVAQVALAQDPPRTTHRMRFTQPDTTCTGNPMADGWLKEYQIFVATPTDTVYYGVVEAPFALADTVTAYVSLQVGVPQSVRVLAVDIWDQLGCKPSEWSDTYIPIPDPPGQGGRPFISDLD